MTRAVSYLRSVAFFVYPQNRGEFAARSHRRMKADDEWETLEARMGQTDKLWKGIFVYPLVALRPYDPDDPVCQQLDQVCDHIATSYYTLLHPLRPRRCEACFYLLYNSTRYAHTMHRS